MTAVVRPGTAVSIAQLPTREQVLPQARRENFTVASRILGRSRARHLMAIYGYARLVDDVGDEAAGDRDALLNLVELELRRVFGSVDGPPQHPLMQELARTVGECSLPAAPFERLLEANRVDQRVARYQTFEQLLGYCDLSAAPVGELVLGVFGAATPERVALSDRICAALQVAEHLQDIAEDHRMGRIYMPQDDLARVGCNDEDLVAAPSAKTQKLIALESARARALLSEGAPLARTLPPAPRFAIAGFVAGGHHALDALEGRGSRMRDLKHLLRAVVGR